MTRARDSFDAVVIGSGPNGLAAAIALAAQGRAVRVYEAEPTIGGGTRSAELTLPGFVHDVCSTVHALVCGSPFFRTLPLAEHGLRLVHPDAPFAHPLDDGTAVVCERSIDATADGLDRDDARTYRRLMQPLVDRFEPLMEALLGPVGRSHPFLMAWAGPLALQSAAGLAKARFSGVRARALFAGAAAHAVVPLEYLGTSGYAIALMTAAHAVGWPVAEGGSRRVAAALAAHLESLGGEIVTGTRVESLDMLPPRRATLCDVTPRQLLRTAGAQLPEGYRRRLSAYRYGPGVFKMDWALSAPVPWRAAACARAGTVHLGGTLDDIAASERAPWEGKIHDEPYVLLVQPSRFDPTRAPAGKHTLWAYCHVPNGATVDMTSRIEAQIERFAPGFRDCILARHAMGPADLERGNANLVGGDIVGGAGDLRQVIARPVLSLTPWATPVDGLYLCSASTPPGGGVHGMCGYHAARAALRGALR